MIRKTIIIGITMIAAVCLGLCVSAVDMLGMKAVIGALLCMTWLYCFGRANGFAI